MKKKTAAVDLRISSDRISPARLRTERHFFSEDGSERRLRKCVSLRPAAQQQRGDLLRGALRAPAGAWGHPVGRGCKSQEGPAAGPAAPGGEVQRLIRHPAPDERLRV